MSNSLVLMSTGVETWNQNLLDIGPMYPFPGTEMFWVILGVALWILWHICQARTEANEVKDEQERAKRGEHY
jgi:hypothetical protein